MKTVVLGDPPPLLASLIADRKRLGLDRHDEVWQGEYHIAPAASYAHGRAEAILASLLRPIAIEPNLRCVPRHVNCQLNTAGSPLLSETFWVNK